MNIAEMKTVAQETLADFCRFSLLFGYVHNCIFALDVHSDYHFDFCNNYIAL